MANSLPRSEGKYEPKTNSENQIGRFPRERSFDFRDAQHRARIREQGTRGRGGEGRGGGGNREKYAESSVFPVRADNRENGFLVAFEVMGQDKKNSFETKRVRKKSKTVFSCIELKNCNFRVSLRGYISYYEHRKIETIILCPWKRKAQWKTDRRKFHSIFTPSKRIDVNKKGSCVISIISKRNKINRDENGIRLIIENFVHLHAHLKK